jgi:hypothetical protein
MTITALVIAIIVVLIVLFVIAKIIRSCLPKIVIGLLILGVLAYLAYRYFTK